MPGRRRALFGQQPADVVHAPQLIGPHGVRGDQNDVWPHLICEPGGGQRADSDNTGYQENGEQKHNSFAQAAHMYPRDYES